MRQRERKGGKRNKIQPQHQYGKLFQNETAVVRKDDQDRTRMMSSRSEGYLQGQREARVFLLLCSLFLLFSSPPLHILARVKWKGMLPSGRDGHSQKGSRMCGGTAAAQLTNTNHPPGIWAMSVSTAAQARRQSSLFAFE